MCQKVECATCNKPTWRGCGQHIEQTLAGIPASDRCQCPRSFLADNAMFLALGLVVFAYIVMTLQNH
ncbi:hypothetical protein BC833DRAFT_592009 [Globomyces pollinis-pini]|nr:hypothetical protein BC833DRAFT_592009 [Globomyces pollinis-pini]